MFSEKYIHVHSHVLYFQMTHKKYWYDYIKVKLNYTVPPVITGLLSVWVIR